MASTTFDGFSEEDLRKIRDGLEVDHKKNGDTSRPKKGDKKASGKRKSSQSVMTKKGSARDVPSSLDETTKLRPDQMLSPPTRMSIGETSEARQVKLKCVGTDPSEQTMSGRSQLSSPNGLVKLCVKSDGHSVEVVSGVPAKLKPSELSSTKELRAHLASAENGHGVDDEGECGGCPGLVNGCASTAGKSKKVSLEEFQLRQKMIEEQNRKRRLMLTRAIADRKQKTLAETEKLTQIQRELQKLDSLVSNDVAILRDHIEVASMEFNEVQKRYEKAEREFVEAKIELFQKMERKEQLTEHLCTIIEQNEMRKAHKLADLMHELQLDAVMENLHQDEPILPQLYALNDIAYTYCTTLRDSKGQLPSPSVADDKQLPDASCISPTCATNSETGSVHPVKTVESDSATSDTGHNGDVHLSCPDTSCCGKTDSTLAAVVPDQFTQDGSQAQDIGSIELETTSK